MLFAPACNSHVFSIDWLHTTQKKVYLLIFFAVIRYTRHQILIEHTFLKLLPVSYMHGKTLTTKMSKFLQFTSSMTSLATRELANICYKLVLTCAWFDRLSKVLIIQAYSATHLHIFTASRAATSSTNVALLVTIVVRTRHRGYRLFRHLHSNHPSLCTRTSESVVVVTSYGRVFIAFDFSSAV